MKKSVSIQTAQTLPSIWRAQSLAVKGLILVHPAGCVGNNFFVT